MSPEKFNSSHEQQTKPFDLREFFVVDKDYYFGRYAPLIVLIPHSRIRTQSSLLFDSAFQILTTLNLVSTSDLKPVAEHSINKYKSQHDR